MHLGCILLLEVLSSVCVADQCCCWSTSCPPASKPCLKRASAVHRRRLYHTSINTMQTACMQQHAGMQAHCKQPGLCTLSRPVAPISRRTVRCFAKQQQKESQKTELSSLSDKQRTIKPQVEQVCVSASIGCVRGAECSSDCPLHSSS